MSISVNKRLKERAREERNREKAAKKQQRRDDKGPPRSPTANGVDPDIAGIIPGPQPLAEEDA